MPAFILDMLELPGEIRSIFEAGQFAIRQTSGKFNVIWSDMDTQQPLLKSQRDSVASLVLRVRSLYS
jgi:hypothetical protein